MKIRSVVLLLFVCSFPLPALAADHLQGVSELILTGHASEARTRLEAAAAAYKAEGDARHEGISLMLLGFANVELRDDAAARSNLEEAAEKLGSTSDYFTAWMALHYAAAFEMREAKWARAVERHQAALAMLRQGAQAGTFSLEAAMLLGPMFGFDVGPLATLASSIPEMLKPVFLQLGEMMSRDALGSVYTELGELDRAGTELMRAQQLSSGLMGAYDTSIAEHVGDLRRRQWRLDEARDTYRKALDGVPLLPAFLLRDQLLELRILDRLAEIEMLRGDIDAALGWNDRAQKLIRPLKNPARDASILEDRAFLLMQASRFTDATQLLRQAQTLAEKSGDVKMQARILTSIGSLEFFRGEYGTAPSTMERAIELYQKVKDPTGESHAWLMLSQLYLTIGASDSATISIGKARALAAKSPFAPSRAIVELVAASATLGENGPSPDFMQKLDRFLHDPELGGLFPTEAMLTMFDRAIAIGTGREPVRGRETPGAGTLPMLSEMATLLQARDLILRGEGKTARELLTAKLGTAPGNETRFGYLALIAGSWVREGNHAEASRWFKQAIEVLEQPAAGMADDELIAGYFGTGRRWLFDFAIEALLHEGKAAEAFDYAERARARAFLQLIGNHRLSPGRGGNERLVREAEALRTRIAEWERAGSAIPTDLANARREYRTLIGRLKTTNLEYASLARVEPLSVEAIRQEIPAGTTVISYFVSVQGLHAWVLDEKNLVHVALPGEPAAVQRAACWAMQFGNGRLRGPKPRTQRCAVPATAEDVYDLLIRPLRGKIGNARLIIIPHGVLHYVPFAALRDRTNGRYLIEDYTFTLAPSASALRFLRAKETPVTGRALVLGNPDSRMGALPGAQREAIAVARAFGTTPLLGPAAAESLLYGLHGEVDLLHISAHARYDDAAPTFSRIGLAAGRGHDGNLEVHEILADVDLTGVNLVVLSACETAVGQRSGGDDVVSLTRAILYAGSPGVISTLWAIDDQAAARLMEEFYRRLLDGLPAADALRAAQLALLHDKTNNEPKFWAAFTLTGNPSATWKRGAAAGPR